MATQILFVSYYFPPLGGAGVQRTLKFVRYLPEHGYEALILTGTGQTEGWWEPKDPVLGQEVPPGLQVCRPQTSSPSTEPASRMQRFLGRQGAFADWWVEQILDLGPKMAKRYDPALVYVTISPYESLAPAVHLAQRLGLPLLADLRDPWALDENRIYTTAWHRRRELRRLGALLPSCSRVLWNCKQACLAAREAFPDLPESRFSTLENGYDEEDFQDIQARPSPKFTMTHVGFLHTAKGQQVRARPAWLRRLGGELWSVDFLARSHFYLLQALQLVQDRHPEWRGRWELRLVGPGSPQDHALIRERGLGDEVKITGYMSHAQAVQEMVDADLLFLPHHGLPAGKRARTVPGKVYEYLRSKRPILAALPDGDARDLVAGGEGNRLVDPDDVQGMAECIETRMETFLREGRAPDLEIVRGLVGFERRSLTQRLAAEFSSLLDAAPGPAGGVRG